MAYTSVAAAIDHIAASQSGGKMGTALYHLSRNKLIDPDPRSVGNKARTCGCATGVSAGALAPWLLLVVGAARRRGQRAVHPRAR